jgi:P27 family predicted phage terminase small subunit
MPRRKKPNELKVFQGTYRPDRDGEIKPIVAPASYKLPETITMDKAQKLWYMVVESYQKMKMLNQMDIPALEIMCLEYQRYWEYEELIKGTGAVQKLKDRPLVNPYIKLREKAFENFKEFAMRFGLTPSDRAKIQSGEVPQEVQPLRSVKNF